MKNIELTTSILSNLIKSRRRYFGKPLSMPITHYASVFIKIFKTGQPWYTLNEKLHYSVYHKHFINYVNKNIFDDFFDIIKKLTNKLPNIDNNLYIDSAIVRNVKGVEDIDYNYKIKNKRGSKITILVNSLGIPISVHLSSASVNDVKLVYPTLDKVNNKTKYRKNIITDKGYISKKIKHDLYTKHKINYIYPMRDNMKTEISLSDKELIKKRNINERSFSWMMQYRHISSRYDIYSNTYMAFIKLAICDMVLKKIYP